MMMLSQLTACQIVHLSQPIVQVPIIKIFPTEQLVFEIQNTDLLSSEKQEMPTANEIDPLSEYIESYESDPVMYQYVQKVKLKRDEKCNKVTRYYEKMPLNQSTVDEVAENYSYSCPYLVASFIDRLATTDESNDGH
jgi:hypothetical protein